MLSRAKTLEGLLVLRPAKREELQTRPPKYLLDELARLEALEKSSLPELLNYITSLQIDIPEIVQNTLAADAVDNEQCLVSAKRAAQRVSGSGSTNSAHIVPASRKRVGEPPPTEQPLKIKRYR